MSLCNTNWKDLLSGDTHPKPDVEFLVVGVGGQRLFPAHQYLLAIVSPVFKEQFYEKSQKGIDKNVENGSLLRIKLDTSPSAAEAFFRYIYEKIIGKVSFHDWFELLKLSEKYQMEKLSMDVKESIAKFIADNSQEAVEEIWKMNLDKNAKEIRDTEVYNVVRDMEEKLCKSDEEKKALWKVGRDFRKKLEEKNKELGEVLAKNALMEQVQEKLKRNNEEFIMDQQGIIEANESLFEENKAMFDQNMTITNEKELLNGKCDKMAQEIAQLVEESDKTKTKMAEKEERAKKVLTNAKAKIQKVEIQNVELRQKLGAEGSRDNGDSQCQEQEKLKRNNEELLNNQKGLMEEKENLVKESKALLVQNMEFTKEKELLNGKCDKMAQKIAQLVEESDKTKTKMAEKEERAKKVLTNAKAKIRAKIRAKKVVSNALAKGAKKVVSNALAKVELQNIELRWKLAAEVGWDQWEEMDAVLPVQRQNGEPRKSFNEKLKLLGEIEKLKQELRRIKEDNVKMKEVSNNSTSTISDSSIAIKTELLEVKQESNFERKTESNFLPNNTEDTTLPKLLHASLLANEYSSYIKEKGRNDVTVVAPTPSVFGGSATGSTANFGQAATFGQPAAPQAQQAPGSSIFGGGATSVFGQKPSISTSAFGAAPGAGTTSAFGAAPGAGTTSAFGAAPVSGTTSAFGAAPASGATSAFGAAPASGATSAFGAAPAAGATSSFGAAQPSGATSAFGAAPAAGATSVFGQPARSTSVFGVGNSSTSQPTSFFTQPPANQSSSIFAPSTTQASASIFGNSAGQSLTSQSPAQPNPGFGAAPPSTATAAFSSTPSPFGATSPFSSNPPEAGAGGAPGQSLFGQSAAPSQGMFGKPSGPNAKIKTLADEKKQMGEEMETMKDANVKAKVSLSFDLSGEDTIVESEDLRMSLDQRKIEESEDLRMSLYQRQRRVFEEVEDGDELEDGEYVDTEVSKEEDVNMIHVTVPNNQDDEASNPDLENGSKKRKAAHRRVRCQENIMSGIKKIKSNEETAEINQGDPKDASNENSENEKEVSLDNLVIRNNAYGSKSKESKKR